MNSSPLAAIETHFRSLTDPRAEHSIKHDLLDIVMIKICAVSCGADNWVEVENYGHAKIEWQSAIFRITSRHSISRYIDGSLCTPQTRAITAMFSELDTSRQSDN